jgi:4-hydroxy 2-oxovalerate aldolase
MKILDCTLRDGGYYTNWDFNKKISEIYFHALSKLPVDYIEIGYRSPAQTEYYGEYFYCPQYVIELTASKSNKKLAVMLNEKDVNPTQGHDLLEPLVDKVALVRIAINPENITRGIKLAEVIKQMGFEVGFNVMYMSQWYKYKGFFNELKELNGLADYLYLVDSYGGVYPSDVIRLVEDVKNHTSVKLGYHGHNNLELALINTLTAIDMGVEIVDATITGMGRGAGNLKTELLLTAINNKYGLGVDFNELGKLVNAFENLRKEYEWGTNLPYMISGANSLPQKDVMEWVTKRFYSFNSILQALENQKLGVQDNVKLPLFRPKKTYKKALIVGGGPNAVIHSEAILNFLKQTDAICIIHASSKNASKYFELKNDQYFCLVGSEGHRLEEVFKDMRRFKGVCVLPPYPRKMGTYIPHSVSEKCYELSAVHFTDKLHDSHTVLALQTAILLEVKEIYFTGYDGYQSETITQLEKSLSEENESTLDQFAKNTAIPFSSLTPSNYKNLPLKSVYSFLV